MTHLNNHEFDYAVQVPVLHTTRKINPKFLVMHYTAGFTAQSAINAYKSRRVSAHLTLDLDGTLYQHVPFDTAAWHAGPSRHMGYSGLNNHSIGIEIVNAGWFRKDGNTYHRDRIRKSAREMPPMEAHRHSGVGSGVFWWPKYTNQQLDALDEITEDILGAYNILDVTTHEEIDTRGWKTDPGPAFPIDRYKRLMATTQSHRDIDSDAYQVTARSLNVRFGPGTSFDVSGKLRHGDIVQVIDERGDWARVNANGDDDGWVHQAYIRRV